MGQGQEKQNDEMVASRLSTVDGVGCCVGVSVWSGLGLFHHQWIPDIVGVESDFPEATVKALEAKGYKITKRGRFGRMDGVIITKDGKRTAVGDKRGDDSVYGY